MDFLDDVAIRLVLLASYGQALETMKAKMLRLGGASSLDEETRVVESIAVVNTEFIPQFGTLLGFNWTKARLSDRRRAEDALLFYLSELGIQTDNLSSVAELVFAQAKFDDADADAHGTKPDAYGPD